MLELTGSSLSSIDEDRVEEVVVNGATPSAHEVRQQLSQEAAQFMEKVATFRKDGKLRKQESFFDTVVNSISEPGKGPTSRRVSKVRTDAMPPSSHSASPGTLSSQCRFRLFCICTLRIFNKFVTLKYQTHIFLQIIKVTLEWKDLTYTVQIGHGKKRSTRTILENLTSQVPPGRLVAVMGPTGCGKTSLINALAGRLPAGGLLTGSILVNGKTRGRGFRSISAYVMQDDVLFSNLTVRETFEFSARMRLPSEVSFETKQALVSQIITELGLVKAQDTRIGNQFVRGVSGGERKRTNIGIELLSGASLIFLDEPTSGLDAFQAQNVMESLWTLAGNGRTVLSTIHQPRSSIYKMFDLLLLLSEGKCIYYGSAAEATGWFADGGFPCPAEFNPADFFLDIVSPDMRSPEAEASSRARIDLLTAYYSGEGSSLHRRLSVDSARMAEMEHVNEAVSFPNDPFTEFGLLLSRSWKQQSRDRLPQIITIVQTVVIGFFLAALYSDMVNSDARIQDETGIIFFICIFSAFGAMFGALNSFPTERGVVNRERAGKMYHVLPYYLARFICDIPLRVGQGLLFGCIVYWIVGLNPSASAFFIFVCVLVVEGLAAQGLGVAVSAGARNEKVALAIAPAVTVILILFGGFYVNAGTIPVWLSWIKYLSHLYWAFMALAINNFAGRTGWQECPDGSLGQCIPVTGDQILNKAGFNPGELWLAFVGLLALIIGYNFVGYVLLRRSKPKFLPLAAATEHKKTLF